MIDGSSGTEAALVPPTTLMRARRLAARPGWMPVAIPRTAVSAMAFLALALMIRAMQLGNPVIHVDEEFYLLVARRWSEGALPFVDIWDRKPIGLFLLYRFFLLFPGDGVVTYQLFGIAATAGTALVIERMARELASPAGAFLAGIAYILFLPAFSFGAGQGPVFYNLPVALAALGAMQAFRRPDANDLTRRGVPVMLLLGLAIQIKYTVIFEGAALGLLLLARGWSDAWPWRRLLATAALWCGIALAPTLLVLGAYAAMGHGDAFIQANFVSILARRSDGYRSWVRLAKEAAALIPFWLAIFHAGRKLAPRRGIDARAELALRTWAVAAVLGFLVFGTWYDHYVAPMLPPLAVLAAPALGRSAPGEQWYARLLLGFGAIAGVVVMIVQIGIQGTTAQAEHVTNEIRRELHGGCLFPFDGAPAFYSMTGSCIATRYAFPNHLNTWIEAGALGTDPAAEVRRIMRSRPDVVVIAEWKELYLPNWQTRRIVLASLAQGYEHYASVQLGHKQYGLWRRRKA
ncbi:hypothetical protein OLX02_15455 [Novosphingobium sp. KCTC 2891]|uniref:ArnT family glycosyltransferase n=1 Tax=Novosphingobium sp. KCTC 2891 TaxID=2989730 RepID=UPI002222CD9A|nr:hypothetical protein [Novosphingobium sp. KCTC 2891]MCW1384220.1 hypothetical protein [Novosphingobium sp. KCTC 2891]